MRPEAGRLLGADLTVDGASFPLFGYKKSYLC